MIFIKIKQLEICGFTLIITLIIVGLYSFLTINALLPLIALPIAAGIYHLCSTKVKELQDERGKYVTQNASKSTIAVFVLASALIGIVLIIFKSSIPQNYFHTGISLIHSANALILLYAVFYIYFNHKSGWGLNEK